MIEVRDTPAGARSALRSIPVWRALEQRRRWLAQQTLRELFAADPRRAERHTVEAAGWRLDYSKQLIDDEVLAALFALARERGLEQQRDAMFAGEKVNVTEARAALHIALRAPADRVIRCDGVNVVPQVQAVLSRMTETAEAVRSGRWIGYSGRPIRNVVNIGIGGSHLGPSMACQALQHYADPALRLRFVSNVDATDFVENTRDLRPDETLFIVASKAFSTLETMTNARTAREWLRAAAGDAKSVDRHFLAVSTNLQAVEAFGIPAAQTFAFWDWVGGRYSMDSAIGLPIMIAIGASAFRELLAGFHAMDEHFRHAPLAANLPAIMGLLGVWNVNFLGAETVAVLPYEQYLARLPAYLQQLTMESNGKRVTRDGEPVDYATGPIYWGQTGTDGQHSFYQLLHQGTRQVACDFIAFGESLNPLPRHHDLLVANVIAQAEALAFGQSAQALAAEGVPAALVPHQVCPGNRPSNLLLARRLTPASLGSLIALYEHSVFTQAAIWGINPFDQWGVELGKQLAQRAAAEIESSRKRLDHDASTNAAIRWARAARRHAPAPGPQSPRVLVLDVGGSHVKMRVSGEEQPRRFVSGPRLTPQQMMKKLERQLRGWRFDRVSIGIPAPVVHGRLLQEPRHLGDGWVGFDFERALKRRVRLVNDAAMQALGSYQGGRMLFLGLGTGLGSAMIVDGVIEAMELAHLPYRQRTYEYYVAEAYRARHPRKWRDNVFEEIAALRAALQPDYVVLGGGNVRHLGQLPQGVRRGDNDDAFIGGFRLWERAP